MKPSTTALNMLIRVAAVAGGTVIGSHQAEIFAFFARHSRLPRVP